VGVSDVRISGIPGDVLVTHALGSCLGIAVHDRVAQIGGLLHVMLPTSTINPQKAKDNPCMFVDTGVPALFERVLAAGAAKHRLAVTVAGGSAMQGGSKDRFEIGKRNYLMLKKIFWQNEILIDAEDVGGESARTMYLEVGSGRVWLNQTGRQNGS
jgi:chemotaxis protein CheD